VIVERAIRPGPSEEVLSNGGLNEQKKPAMGKVLHQKAGKL
jgi:hypothetical protein